MNGTWTITMSLSDQIIGGTLVLRRRVTRFPVRCRPTLVTSDFSSGTVNGNAFRISATANIQGQSIPITIEGTVRGDSISGTLQSPYGNATFTGSRKP